MTAPLLVAALALAAGPPTPTGELLPPVRLQAGGKVIDTDVGHAAPFVGDFFGRGVNDLLVGQFGDGILWVYRNEGTSAKPKLAPGVTFKEGKADGRVRKGCSVGFGHQL